MNEKLNLARKWRPKQLDEIIGQDIVINLIKNSLYRNLIFPVYLFSGPKGSGKTSTARLFSTALNCLGLKSFIESPQNILLPCLQCLSCQSMAKLAHPDFIEIDAASNTGVENIRQLIETASFSPVLSVKKIYLIDEAHMLSKAAFNAFLKILEEPPKNTIFMLATTNISKIIETVRSRCFQLFFDPITPSQIRQNLEFICKQENINCNKDALNIIADYANGSLRDALNTLEKLRLSNKEIDKNLTFENLGLICSEKLLELLNIIIEQDLNKMINFFNIINLKKFNALIIWKNFIDILYSLFLIKNNIKINTSIEEALLVTISSKISSNRLFTMLEICNSYEFNIMKSSMPHLNLELMFIKLVNQQHHVSQEVKNPDDINVISKNTKLNNNSNNNNTNNNNDKFSKFLREIDQLNDPLLSSIFNQAKINLDKLNLNEVILTFSKEFAFFKDLLDESKSSWEPLFIKILDRNIKLTLQFNNTAENITINKLTSLNKKETNLTKNDIISNKINRSSIDTNDQSKWPRANKILKIFPGKINYQ